MVSINCSIEFVSQIDFFIVSERAGAADADEPQQEVLVGRSHAQRLQVSHLLHAMDNY